MQTGLDNLFAKLKSVNNMLDIDNKHFAWVKIKMRICGILKAISCFGICKLANF